MLSHKIINDQINFAIDQDINKTFQIIGGCLPAKDILIKLKDPEDFLIQVTKNTPDMCADSFNIEKIFGGNRFKPYSALRENLINGFPLPEKISFTTNKFLPLKNEIQQFLQQPVLNMVNMEFRGGNPKNGVWILTYQTDNGVEKQVVFKYCAPVFPNKKNGQVENEQFWHEILKLLNISKTQYQRSLKIAEYENKKAEADRGGGFFMDYISGKNSDKTAEIIHSQEDFHTLLLQFAQFMAISDVFGKADRRPNFFCSSKMDGQYRISHDLTVYAFDNDYLWEEISRHREKLLLETKQGNSESSILLFGKNIEDNKKQFKNKYLETIRELTKKENKEQITEKINHIYIKKNYSEKINIFTANLEYYQNEQWIDKVLELLIEAETYLKKQNHNQITLKKIRSI